MPSTVIKLFYVLVVVIALVPSVLVGIATIYAARQVDRFRLEQQRNSPDTVYVRTHTYALSLGAAEVVIYPRVWAAIIILFGIALWIVGTVFVFFIRQP
jgi:hypothetical protein